MLLRSDLYMKTHRTELGFIREVKQLILYLVCFYIEFLVVLKSRATLKSKKAQRRTLNGDDRSSHSIL